MARRTKEEALETRSRILDAAEQIFHERGVSRTSLHQIALAAGVTRGAVYWHFDDKPDLFNAMMQRVCLPIEESAAATVRAHPDEPLAQLRAHVLDIFDRTANDAQVRRVFEIATQKVEYVDELVAIRERHVQARNDHLTQLTRMLGAARRRGDIRAGVPVRSLAIGVHAIVDGMIQSWILDPGAFDLLRIGAQVLDVHLAGLRT
jgi:TetR/AcrR family acrAB operon transcriptional repressor